jgi:hypothetical protein
MSNIPEAVYEARDLRRRLCLHARDDVGVLLECECRRLMPEPLADHLDRDTGLEGERGVRVPEVVQPDGSQVRLLDQPLERLAERVRVDRLAVLLGHDEVVVLVVVAPLSPLLVLPSSVRPELCDCLGIEVDDAGIVVLRRRVDDLAADGD